jgi:hypothetical protein
MAAWARQWRNPGGGGGGGCLAARPEEDEGRWGPAVRERRGVLGQWVREWGVELGGLGWPSGQGQRGGRAWARKEKKKEIHLKLISRFRKMNKEIRVTEIIGKNPKNSQKIVENLGRQECELE